MQVVETRGTRVEQQDAFDALFFGHAARMVRLARLLGDDDPEDVVQESFCKLYAARGRLRAEDAEVVSYLNKIVVNEVRGRQRRRQVARRDAHLLTTVNMGDMADPTAVHDDRQAVVEALAGVSARQREALVLRFFEDMSVDETARAMGCAAGTVKATVHQALRSLRKRLQKWI